MILTLDIETLPTTDKAVIDALAETITAPGQYKKPESIAEWMRENKEQAVKDLVAKTSFDALYGSIACICYAFDDGEVFSVSVADEYSDECGMLENFYSDISSQTRVAYQDAWAAGKCTVVGHNVHGFDLPFLKQRSIIRGVKPPSVLLKAMKAKPWDEGIADTMLMWSSDSQKRVSMDKLCKAFGIEGKSDFDGSMVADTWPVDPNKVIEYCKDDVRRTREIYKRITFQG